LKMPCKDGRETLRELKADPDWRQIPIVVLTTSAASDDVNSCYQMGVNAYITKPTSFRKLVGVLDAITRYWFGVVQLPPKNTAGGKTD